VDDIGGVGVAEQDLSPVELVLVEQIVANESPSTAVAYMLAIFLGLLSAHRFYLRRPTSAILQILSYFVLFGFIWLLADLFWIPGAVRSARDAIRTREVRRLSSARPAKDPVPPLTPPRVDASFVASILADEGSTAR
jgi:TM2 domain-containing membrane protein YozV